MYILKLKFIFDVTQTANDSHNISNMDEKLVNVIHH